MFFHWINEIHEKRDKMKQIITKAKVEKIPLKELKNRLEQERFNRESVSSLSSIAVELMVFLGVTEEEWKRLGFSKWIV